jgi:hypothetical protein
MHKIEKTEFGFRLTFDGFIKADEMKTWAADSKKALESVPSRFGVFVDMRNLKPLPPDAQAPMEEGQKLYKQKGMERSVVILNSASLTMQFKRIAKETGIYGWERYVDASKTADWEKVGLDWVKKGVDPDKAG